MSHETIAERNLRQAADALDNNNWATARLIACSVEIGAGNGRPKADPGDQVSKLSRVKAAEIMRRSVNTITAYLAAWNAAAADGHCAPAADLAPEDGWTAPMPAAELWEKYRNPNSHSAKPEPKGIPADPVKAIAQAVPKLTPEQKREMVAEVIASDPAAAPEVTPDAVREAIKAQPSHQRAARAALDEVYADSPKPYKTTPDPHPVSGGEDLIFEFRKLHKGVDAIVQMVNDGRARIIDRDALLREISWLRNALGYIEDGVKGGNLADEISAFLREVK